MSYSLSLNMHNKQSLKQTQRLIMSPQMQQAIHLLQLPVLELEAAVEQELEQNPVLEYSDDIADPGSSLEKLENLEKEDNLNGDQPSEQEVQFDDKNFEILKQLDQEFQDHFTESGSFQKTRDSQEDQLKSYLESSITAHSTLFEHLMEQAREHFDDDQSRKAALWIIGNLDERGYLTTSLEEISLLNSVDLTLLQKVLIDIQTFEPFGVGAKDLQESLLIQMRCLNIPSHLAYKIVEHHFDDLLHNRVPMIQKSLNCTAKQVKEAIDIHIKKLDLQPGAWHAEQVVQHITPDITIVEEEGVLSIEVNSESIPRVRLNQRYLKMLEDPSLNQETKEYVKQKVFSGRWLMRNVNQRNDTLYRITEKLMDRQKDFFLEPQGELSPLTMKTIAEELELHESTIARAVSNKYLSSPRGILPLRSFFTNSYSTEEGREVSSQSVKILLSKIVEEENKKKPLSDEAISHLIEKEGVKCARRTVSKYRKELGIGNASQRKSYI